MNRLTCILSLFILVGVMGLKSNAQNHSMKFLVSFTDKDSSSYQISNPHAYLSQRAIDRRDSFNIPVTLHDLPVNSWYVDSLIKAGMDVLSTSKWLNAALVGSNDSLTAIALLQFPFVSAVDLLYFKDTVRSGGKGIQSMEIQDLNLADVAEDFTQRFVQKPSSFNYGYGFAQANILGVNYLHQMGFTGDSMQIAVLDGGFQAVDLLPIFDSLRLQSRILSEYNFVNPGHSVYGASNHGTMVLSTMAGNLPGQLVGTAPHAFYHLLLSEDVGSEFPVEEYYWCLAAEYADSAGADMINSSLAYTTFDFSPLNHSFDSMDGKTTISARAATYAASKGMLVVASAGNGGGSSWFYIGSPADADSIITVGAINVAGEYASFSSTGPTADQRVKPDAAAVGHLATVSASSGGVQQGNGTSFSSPILCGAVACLWQANPSMSNMQIIDAVHRSGHQYHFPDTLLGYGIPNLAVAHLILGGHDFKGDQSKNTPIKITPNPFHNLLMVTFSSSDSQTVDLALFNLQGEKVFQKSCNKTIGYNAIGLDELDHLAAGVYVLRFNDQNNTYTEKVIKQ